MKLFLVLYCLLDRFLSSRFEEENFTTLVAKRGRFFIHRLHVVDFFDRRASGISWSVSVVGRPTLPAWLNLAQSPHRQLAFLYGTPGPDDSTTDILIIAKSKTFEISRKRVQIKIKDDRDNNCELPHLKSCLLMCEYNFYSHRDQIAEIWVKNLDAWRVLADPRIAEKLQGSVRKAFRGEGVRPYVRDLKPADSAGARIPLTEQTVGVVAYVGTARGFMPGVLNLERGLNRQKEHCRRNKIIPLDKYFKPHFLVDWCKFKVVNQNETEVPDEQATVLLDRKGLNPFGHIFENKHGKRVGEDRFDAYSKSGVTRSYFLDWILVVVIPATLLIIVLLVLCIVFFGGREGQHWRDHKTPDDQLKEYMSLRRSQQKLRELSTMRQSLSLIEDEEDQGDNLNFYSAVVRNGSVVRKSTTASPSPTRGPTPGPLGKQTVNEAAVAKGSRLALYGEPTTKETRFLPGDNESDEDTVVNEEDTDINRNSATPKVTVTDTSV